MLISRSTHWETKPVKPGSHNKQAMVVVVRMGEERVNISAREAEIVPLPLPPPLIRYHLISQSSPLQPVLAAETWAEVGRAG